MNKLVFCDFLLCIFFLFMSSFNDITKVNAQNSNCFKNNFEFVEQNKNNFFYTNIISSDKNYILKGFTFVKNDTLYFLQFKTNLKYYKKYPLCIVEKRSRINSSFSFVFKDINQNRSYKSELIHVTCFGNEYFYFFKNYVNVCDLHNANCTKSNSELMVSQRTAFFVYSSKRGIIYFDFHMVIGGYLPYLF